MERQFPPPLPDADDEDLSENGSHEMAPGKRALIRNAALRRFEASPD